MPRAAAAIDELAPKIWLYAIQTASIDFGLAWMCGNGCAAISLVFLPFSIPLRDHRNKA